MTQAPGSNHSFSTTKTLEDRYDYIITGAGCAGLSLAVHLILSGKFGDKKILLVDKDAKSDNDHTWCFWEQQPGMFQPCVYRQWEQLFFHSDAFSTKLNLAPYSYKLIRGIDFYQYCIALIREQENFTLLQAAVDHVSSNEEESFVTVDGRNILCTYIFNSILFSIPAMSRNQYWMLQHFKGWFISTDEPVFDASAGTLMDFRTSQYHGTSFFYVLPFSPTEALIEYTLFSNSVLPDDAYESELQQYLDQRLGIKDYTVREKEFGVIPMTNYPFSAGHANLVNIGTAGGKTKGSSGYTFQYIQKSSAAIVEELAAGRRPGKTKRSKIKFSFYDSVLLNILHHRTLEGRDIFTDLFKNNKPAQVLKFLDNETSIAEDLSIMTTLPTIPFAKAAFNHLLY